MRYSCLAQVSSEDTEKTRLPFYTAEFENSLTRDGSVYTVEEILREVFHEDFYQAIQFYLDVYPEDMVKASGRNVGYRFQLIRLSHPKVESSLKQDLHNMTVDLVVRAIIETIPDVSSGDAVSDAMLCSAGKNHRKTDVGNGRMAWNGEQNEEWKGVKKSRFQMTFRLRYILSLLKKSCSAPIIAPAKWYPQDLIVEQKTAITNEYLLPILYNSDYPKIARWMLEEYYPEALTSPTAVDGWKLADNMELTVRKVRFAQEPTLKGRVYFEGCMVWLVDEWGNPYPYEVKPLTILISKDLCTSPAIENSTIVHECIHVFLHMPFFLLQLLSGHPYHVYANRGDIARASIDREVIAEGYESFPERRFPQRGQKIEQKSGKKYKKNNAVGWMELQTEKLTAYVRMEEKQTGNLIEKMLAERGGVRSPENLLWIMNQLAAHFNVSRAMAKYRMIELGYPEAEGIYSYIENRRIPDYGCAGTWQQNITYAISRIDAGALLRKSSKFAQILSSGRYVYVDGHYCLDAEPYITYNGRKEKVLTDYALHHIDECCLSFSVRGRYSEAEYVDGQAARKTPVTNQYRSRHDLDGEPDSKKSVKQNKSFTEDAVFWSKIKRYLYGCEEIKDAIDKIMEDKGLSREQAAMKIGVSKSALQGWLSKRMSMRHIIAIAVGLDVRGDVAEELVHLAGYSFQNNREHDIMLSLLYEPELKVAKANEIMRQNGFQPLTKGENEELCYCEN